MYKLRVKHFIIFLIISVIIILSQCTALSRQSVHSSKRVVQDQAGRKVHVPQKVDRVVTALYPISTQFVLLLKAQEKLVGISKYSVNEVMRRIYPEVSSIPQLGFTPHSRIPVEHIIRLHPDIVFTHYGNRKKYLNAVGFSTFVLSVESPKALIRGIQLTGKVLGRQARAKEVASYYRKKLHWIRQETAAIDNKKRVYFAGPDMLSTAGGQRYQDFMIQAAGGINVAKSSKEGWSGITLEQLISWDPQVIIVADYCSATPKTFLTDPRLKEIQAVKTDNVFKVPSFILSWDVPSPESLLGIMWLSNTLYPSTINFDLNKIIKRFYLSMYDYNPSNSELSAMLD